MGILFSTPSYNLKTKYIPIIPDPNKKSIVLFISPDPNKKFVKNANGTVNYMNPDDNEKNYTTIKLDEYFKLKIDNKLNEDEYCLTQIGREIEFSKKIVGASIPIIDKNTLAKYNLDVDKLDKSKLYILDNYSFNYIYNKEPNNNYKIFAIKDSNHNSYTINVIKVDI